MPASITFDTHAYVKKLKAVGFTEEQAEVLSSTQAELIEERLATKQDIEKLETVLKQHIQIESAKIKADVIKWVAGMLVAQAAIVATLVKLL